jgi:hypothetical protein
MYFRKHFAEMRKRGLIGHTEYFVEIVSKEMTRAVTRKDSRQLTDRIEKLIEVAILRAARATIKEQIKAGKLSARFSARMIS